MPRSYRNENSAEQKEQKPTKKIHYGSLIPKFKFFICDDFKYLTLLKYNSDSWINKRHIIRSEHLLLLLSYWCCREKCCFSYVKGIQISWHGYQEQCWTEHRLVTYTFSSVRYLWDSFGKLISLYLFVNNIVLCTEFSCVFFIYWQQWEQGISESQFIWLHDETMCFWSTCFLPLTIKGEYKNC